MIAAMNAMTPEFLESTLSAWTTLIAMFGGGTVIVWGLIAWLGHVQVGRILEKQKGEQAQALERLRADLQRDVMKVQTELSLSKDKEFSGHREKVELYRMAILPFTELLAHIHGGTLSHEHGDAFEQARLTTHCHLAMFASQEVFDAYADLIDFLYDALEQKQPYEFHQVRAKALVLLNRIRADIGYRTDEVTYRGHR